MDRTVTVIVLISITIELILSCSAPIYCHDTSDPQVTVFQNFHSACSVLTADTLAPYTSKRFAWTVGHHEEVFHTTMPSPLY